MRVYDFEKRVPGCHINEINLSSLAIGDYIIAIINGSHFARVVATAWFKVRIAARAEISPWRKHLQPLHLLQTRQKTNDGSCNQLPRGRQNQNHIRRPRIRLGVHWSEIQDE